MEKLIYIAITLLCGICLMMIHELPKNIVYCYIRKKEGKEKPKKILCIWRNIDPVGIITTLAMYTPFSKQYKYTISNKKTSLAVGITGLGTLALTFFLSIISLKVFFYDYITGPIVFAEGFEYYAYLCILNLALLSMTMLLVNLFPITCFDMGLIILGSNSKNRSIIIIFDGFFKLVFFLMIVLSIFINLSTIITNSIIAFIV